MSIILHPDKNSAEDADIQFRNLVSMYEVLKDPVKREKYDNVLKNGLPNWKSALYYYRKARKVGLLEGALLLFVIITIGQYLVSWAVYLEKKYTMEQMFETRAKRAKKANIDVDSILNEIPKPSIKNTLPFQIPFGIYYLIVGAPDMIKGSVNLVAEEMKKEQDRKQKLKEEEELIKKLTEERSQQKIERKEGLRKRKEQQSKLLERTDEELAAYSATIIKHKGNEEIKTKVPISGGLWTDEDLTELTRYQSALHHMLFPFYWHDLFLFRLTKKYPGGTVDRWEIIAEAMERNVSEVTFMAYKIKDNIYQTPGETEKIIDTINKELKTKIKKKAPDTAAVANEKSWSQEQQKALEAAIQKFPKGGNEDRWGKIANSVPGKTREECQIRYKHLVELVKKQKEAKEVTEDVTEKAVDEAPIDEPTIEEEKEEIQENLGGKKRNKRKEKKKQFDYYAEDSENSESEWTITRRTRNYLDKSQNTFVK